MQFNALPVLETERLTLRPITMDDALHVFAYARNPEVCRLLIWGPHTSIDETKAVISQWIDNYQDNEPAPWGIIDKKTNTVIGTVEARIYPPERYHAELGYCLSQAYWGKGIMVEAVKKVVEYLFLHTDIIEISAYARIDNTQSQRVLEKVGFHKSGDKKYEEIKGVVVECEQWKIIKTSSL